MNAPAYQADGHAVSREAFYAIACDPQRSAVVEACAGAGKTWMLVSRIVRALLDGAAPHEILAITFTRKAAGEMSERLNDWLRAFAAPGFSDEQRAAELVLRGLPSARARELAPALAGLYERLLVNGRGVQIRTFHAWFAQLLRAAPLDLLAELGLQPGMALIEDLAEHSAAVFRRFHAGVLADASLQADYQALVQGRGRDQVRAWLDAALQKRVELELADQAGVLEASVPPAAGEGHPAQVLQTAAWRSSLRELALLLGRGGTRAQDAATGLVMALAHTDAALMFETVWQALFTEKNTPRKQLGTVPQLASLQSELESLAAQVKQHEAHVEHLRLVRLSRLLLRELAAYKRERGLADMADLERCALALLRDNTLSAWVQERLDARIRHVLIDEFQDTSPLQWHALHSWLSAYAGAGGGASGQRAPGVFIVGDPKQSIYRFRRAEPRVFAAAREFVGQGLGGAWLACDHTRRNSPQVLAAINQVFSRAELAGEYGGFRAHTTEQRDVAGPALLALPPVLRPAKADKAVPAQPLPWRDSLLSPRHEPEELLREQEARGVALAIQELLGTAQARPGEVFVLCRKRASLRLVASALQALHLPFAAAEEFSLMDAPEVRDLVAVLDAIVSPRHSLALAQTLRSPMFGAADDDLVAIALQAGEAGGWWAALTQGLCDERPVLQRARSLLLAWQALARSLPPHDVLDRIVCEGGYRERVAAAVPAERRLAALDAIDALLAQALMLDGARYATPYNFVRALKRRAIKVAAPAQPDAVQLLTVHGAKGLEAKVVFVMDAQPEANKAETASLLVDWPVDADRPSCCAFLYSEAQCPPALQPLLAQEKAARQREELNGLYVAMTRACERLVFSRTQPHRAAPSWWERIEDGVQDWVPQPVAASVHPSASPQFTLTVLPALAAHAGPGTPAQRSDSEASRIGQAVHRLLEWASSGTAVGAEIEMLATAAAAEFAAPAAEVARVGQAIWRSPACRRFFAPEGLLWAGNEVPVAHAGELLRIDRLVALSEGGRRVWWVLDYKLALQPQAQPALREQLLRYRAAVAALQPGEAVACALINGQGSVIDLTPEGVFVA